MKKIIWVLCAFLGIFSLQSCEEDDVCVGEGTPSMTVVFRDILNSQNLSDTLTIYSSEDINFQNPKLIYQKVFSDSLKLPLSGLDNSKTYFTIQRRSNSALDTLTVNHSTVSEYVSKACGFRIFYDNLSFQTTQNHIQYLIPGESNELKNESKTNLFIVLGN